MNHRIILSDGRTALLSTGATAIQGEGGCPECCGGPSGVDCVCSARLTDTEIAGVGAGGAGIAVSQQITLTTVCSLVWDGYVGGSGGATLCNVNQTRTFTQGLAGQPTFPSCGWTGSGGLDGVSGTVSVDGVVYRTITQFSLGGNIAGFVNDTSTLTRGAGTLSIGAASATRAPIRNQFSTGNSVSAPLGLEFGPTFSIPGVQVDSIANMIRQSFPGANPVRGASASAVQTAGQPIPSLSAFNATVTRNPFTATLTAGVTATLNHTFPGNPGQWYEARLSLSHRLETSLTVTLSRCNTPGALRDPTTDPRVVEAAERLLRGCKGCGDR